MADPLTRPLDNNRILRAISGPSLNVSLGTSLGAVFETPTMTELLGETGKQLNEQTGFTAQQTADSEAQKQQAQITGSVLAREITLTVPGEDRDALLKQYEDVQRDQDLFISSQVQDSIDAGQLQSKESLDEQHKDLGLTFNRPMSSGEADILAQNKRAEITRNAIIQAGPEGAVATGLKFGAGLAAMATDPLEIATMFIPIVGQAGKVAAVARFGRVGGRVAVGAIEGGVGNALTEPAFFGLSKQLQLDYTMSDALLNIGLGAAFGGGIGSIGGALSRANAPTRADVPEGIAGVAVPEKSLDRVSLPNPDDVRVSRADPGLDQSFPQANRAASETALRQFVNAEPVDVSILTARPPRRPQTIMEFVRQNGGVNDEDVTFRGELKTMGLNPAPRNNGVNNPTSLFNLDDMADAAHQAGFIESRDVGVLTEKIRNELDGDFTFSRFDNQVANDWRDFHQTRNDLDAWVAERDAIREDLNDLGVSEVSDGEISRISEVMATESVGLDAAYKSVLKLDAEMPRANVLAKNADNVVPFEDVKTARVFNETVNIDRTKPDLVQDDIDIFDGMVKQIDETEGLTVEQRQSLDDVTAMEERATAYADISKVAATCLART